MPVSKAILSILTTTARSTYKLYGPFEGVVPEKRVAVYSSCKPATVTDCLDCKVYEDRGSCDNNIVLFWIPDCGGKSYEIIEESIDRNTMNCLLTAATSTPDLLWLKGTLHPAVAETSVSVVDLTNFPDLESLKQTNQHAISDAQNRSVASITDNISISPSLVVVEHPKKREEVTNSISPPVPVAADDDISTLTRDVEDNRSDDVDVAAIIPAKVLKSEKMLVDTLANLNDLRKKIYVVEINVGGHRVKLQTFHYPEINLEAPRNKSNRTYIDADDVPILFSYEFKSALTTQVKVIPMTTYYLHVNIIFHFQLLYMNNRWVQNLLHVRTCHTAN